MGWKHILEVPKRKKGMTSSGAISECHQNVNKLVNTIGGSALRGYWLTENRDMEQGNPPEDIEFLDFVYHSVWITPEGNATDVTMRNWEDPYEPWFIPLYQTSDSTMKVWMDVSVDEDWVKKGLYVTSADAKQVAKIIPIAKFRNYHKKWKDGVRRSWTDEGDGFSKPSIVSKMNFDEFEKLYKDQREFGGFGEETSPRIIDGVRQIKE
tara:strand:- start:3214 stop:3840 length:627 start_codon:yes stop_codon:yes gene_type:complete